MKSKREIKNQVKFEILEGIKYIIDTFPLCMLIDGVSEDEQTVILKEFKFQIARIEKFIKLNPANKI